MKLEPDEQRVVDDVDKHGWHCLWIGRSHDDPDDAPIFAYSIGLLHTLGAPELIVFGLEVKLMHSMLWQMFRQIREGRVVADGARWEHLIEGFPCITRPVHESQIAEHFGYGLWHHRYRRTPLPFKAFQIFWPAKPSGRFPWEEGCAQIVIDCQPDLTWPRTGGTA